MQVSGPYSNPSIHRVADKVGSRKPPIAPVLTQKPNPYLEQGKRGGPTEEFDEHVGG